MNRAKRVSRARRRVRVHAEDRQVSAFLWLEAWCSLIFLSHKHDLSDAIVMREFGRKDRKFGRYEQRVRQRLWKYETPITLIGGLLGSVAGAFLGVGVIRWFV